MNQKQQKNNLKMDVNKENIQRKILRNFFLINVSVEVKSEYLIKEILNANLVVVHFIIILLKQKMH